MKKLKVLSVNNIEKVIWPSSAFFGSSLLLINSLTHLLSPVTCFTLGARLIGHIFNPIYSLSLS